MTTNTDIAQLKFNKMSSAKYEELKEAGQLVENEFYITPDGGAIPEFNTETSQQILSNDGTNLIWCEEQIGYNQVTNCIIEIPQDIKLELNNGTITLKAGSKVYNADESIYDIDSDYSVTPKWGVASGISTNLMVFPVITNNKITGLDATNQSLVFSGDTAPTFSGNYAYWLDTANNKVKYTNDAGTSWLENRALPLCLVSTLDNSVSSIDVVFNGVGFMSNQIYITPDIKSLVCAGKNSNGSLNTVLIESSRLQIYNEPDTNNEKIMVLYQNEEDSQNVFRVGNFWFEQNTKPSFIENSNQFWYNPDTNKVFYYRNSSTNYYQNCALIGKYSVIDGKIQNFNLFNTIDILKRTDKSWVAQQAMPSSKYVDLELGVSGTTYTALANGYIQFVKQATASGQYMVAYDNDLPSTSVDENTIAIKWSTSGVNDVLYFPVRKGQKFTIGYTFDGPTVAFRIIFAQGDS